MAIRIKCIVKDGGNHTDRHEGITNFGWANEQTRATGTSTRAQMIEFLEKQGGKAYVKDPLENIAYIGIFINAKGTKYLKTHADGKWTDNLLSLDEC
ncbi:MAG: DUF3892 domain-containing protein [Candidatus Zambryskibacteria bacterium]|nr:DUF3892 domain-containing protein [Candidatus Zambryskibacteria bacterium]